jgi:hypothetical protein
MEQRAGHCSIPAKGRVKMHQSQAAFAKPAASRRISINSSKQAEFL